MIRLKPRYRAQLSARTARVSVPPTASRLDVYRYPRASSTTMPATAARKTHEIGRRRRLSQASQVATGAESPVVGGIRAGAGHRRSR